MIVAPLRALIPDFAAVLAGSADLATTARIERAPTIGDRVGHPNGSRCSSAGLAAAWHPASSGQSREYTGTPLGSRVCCESSSKRSRNPEAVVIARAPEGAMRALLLTAPRLVDDCRVRP